MLKPYFGEIIAFGTVLCWTVGAQFFEAAGKQIGALTVNLVRLLMAFFLFCIFLYITRGEFVPLGFSASAWGWLALSGIIGFSFGDMFLFSAFVEIGPRISMLIMSLAAPLTAIIGWVFLGEIYTLHQWLGIAITILGVSWVVMEKNNNSRNNELVKNEQRWVRDITFKGLVFGFLGMTGQAIGYVISKHGMKAENGYLDPFASTQIRVIAGTIGFIVIYSFLRKWPVFLTSLKNKKGMGFTAVGAFLGPFLGVSLSLFALHYISTGVATTILSLVPIFIIPFSVFLHKEHVSTRGIFGAVIAIGGIVLLIY